MTNDEINLIIGEIRGLTNALLEERKEMAAGVRELCDRVRKVEISVATLLPAKDDIVTLEKKIDRLEAIHNWTIGAAAALSIVGPLLTQFGLQMARATLSSS